MGSVGDFIFGGNKQKQTSDNQSSSSSTSANQSQQSSAQGSVNQSSSNQGSSNNSNNYNLAYGPVASAMAPTLGYTAAGGNMLGAMLGMPGYTANSAPAVANNPAYDYHPPAPVTAPAAGGHAHVPIGRHGAGGATDSMSMLQSLISSISPALQPAAQTPISAPPLPSGPTPGQIAAMQHDGIPGNAAAAMAAQSSGAADRANGGQYRALGGPVDANKPYVVGEHQPEVFVPNQPGTILPSIAHGFGGGNSGGFAGMIRAQPPRVGKGAGGIATPSPVPAPATPPVPPMSTVPGTMPPAPTPAAPATPATPVDPNPQGTALNNFFNSAGGSFLMQQGQNAINSDASAHGTMQSGATLGALQKMGTGLASQYLNDYINHTLDFAKLGLGGASAMSGAGGVGSSSGSSYGNSSSSGASYGGSQGTSTGSSQSTGQASGSSNSSGHQKNGLLPDLAAFGKGGGGSQAAMAAG